MLAFDADMQACKQASRFRRIHGQTPTRAELKVPWACLTLGSQCMS